jgi:hypothetical protein
MTAQPRPWPRLRVLAQLGCACVRGPERRGVAPVPAPLEAAAVAQLHQPQLPDLIAVEEGHVRQRQRRRVDDHAVGPVDVRGGRGVGVPVAVCAGEAARARAVVVRWHLIWGVDARHAWSL